jgi:hypothetical protein
MLLKQAKRKLWRGAVALCAAGTLFGGSCSSDQLNAVAAGFGAVADELSHQQTVDDISFGDWLLSELDDL